MAELGYGATWKYSVVNIGTGGSAFAATAFDDSAWSSGAAAFAAPSASCPWPPVGTTFAVNKDLLLRHHVTIPATVVTATVHFITRDEIWIYWNGALVLHTTDWALTGACPFGDEGSIAVTPVSGDNVLAIRTSDTPTGGGVTDARVSLGQAGVYIDWDGDGFLAGSYDNVSGSPQNVISWSIARGASAEITGGSTPGSATLVLKNPSDIYNPRNTSSALNGLIRDGCPVWIGPNSDGALTGSAPRGLFGGRITDVTSIPSPGRDEPATVEIACEDALSWYQRTPVAVDYEEGRSQGRMRWDALQAADEDRHDLAREITTMPLSHADASLGSVLDAINGVNGTRHLAKPSDELTDWYRYTTRNRQWRLDATVDASLSATSDHVTDTSGWRQSADTTINRQKATVTPILFTPGTFTVWQADTLPFDVTYARPYTRFVEFDDAVRDPVLDLAYTGDTVTSTLTPFATGAKVELTVGAGDSATVAALSVEGRLARRLPDESHEANDTASQAAPRGIRSGGDIGGEYIGVIASAAGIAEHVVWRYGNPQLRPTLTVQNWLPYQFDLDLFDVIAFTSTHLGMDAVLFEIVGLTHDSDFAASASAHLHTTTYVLQECKAQADPGWFYLDDDPGSLLDGTAVLAY